MRRDGRWIVAAGTFCLLTLPVAAQQAPVRSRFSGI